MNSFNCLDSSEKNGNDFRGMVDGLEDEDNIEEMNCNIGKKKRLGIDQVQALERIFEADNKLDPEKKTKLAQELGLQPRQVAIWFQNRRARWKTKQLERDYRLLKSNYEALHLNYSKVEHEKASLVTELRGLKEKLGEENGETKNSANKASSSQSPHPQSILTGKFKDSTHETEPNREIYNTNINFKEGLSDDSGSSGILNNEDNYLNTHPMISMENSVFSLSTPFYHHNPPLMDSRSGAMIKAYQQQNVFTVDDSCNMLLTDQTPLFWYFSDQRN